MVVGRLFKKCFNGFTVVELLIVIVVIAILAAIIIMSYNGIVTRATNAKIVSAARAYASAIDIYHLETGKYPNVEAQYICLPGDYPAGGGFSADVCEMNGFSGASQSTSYITGSSYDLRIILQESKQDLPEASYGQVLDGMAAAFPNQKVRGVLYSDDGAPQVIYHQIGTTECPFGISNMALGSKGVTCIYYFQ